LLKAGKKFDQQELDAILNEILVSRSKLDQLSSLNVEKTSLISFLTQKKQEFKDKKERVFKMSFLSDMLAGCSRQP